jgi:cell division protein FtsQ
MLSLASRRLRAVLAIAVLLMALLCAGLWLRGSSLVRVREVTVTGIGGRQAAEIRDVLTVAARDMTTLDVDEDALRDAVSGYPVVRGLRTSAGFPHRLRIVVDAYDPVAALQSAGSLTAVASEGTLLRGAPSSDLPVVGVKARPGGSHVSDSAALRAVRLLAAAPAPLRERVARAFRGTRGLAATVDGGPKLYFGGDERLTAKWAAAAQVLANDGARGASYVDVRVPERPVAGGFLPRPPDISTSSLG